MGSLVKFMNKQSLLTLGGKKNLSGQEWGSSEGQAEGFGLSSVGTGCTDLQSLSLWPSEVSGSLLISVSEDS